MRIAPALVTTLTPAAPTRAPAALTRGTPTPAAPTRAPLARAGLVTASAVLALGLAACGSDSDPVDAGPGRTDSPVLEQRTEGGNDGGTGVAGTGGAATGGAGSDGVDAVAGIDDAMGGALSEIDAGEGDYTFGLGRESIAEAVQSTFSSANAEAVWEGDTLVLTMDGDATEVRAGYLECSVVGGLVNEADSVAVVFPNGRVDCAQFHTP